MRMKFLATVATGLFLSGMVGIASAASVLYSDSGGNGGYGIGYSDWSSFTTALQNATGNNLVQAANFENYTQMLQHDAIFLDQRWTNGSLSGTETTNITNYIATGRKVVMIGENNSWTNWNNQILGIVGGTYSTQSSATATPVGANMLTNGVGPISLPTAGIASGGTALFDYNFATLWGSNVLTVLDVNVWSNYYWNTGDIFGTNVANWVADSPSVPIPGALWLLGSGLIGLVGSRRKRNQV